MASRYGQIAIALGSGRARYMIMKTQSSRYKIYVPTSVTIPDISFAYAMFTADSPAAIVSPPRRINTRPISLFCCAVSRGIPGVLPAPLVDRSVISTVAVTPFCKTLLCQQIRVVRQSTDLGFCFVTTPFSEIETSLLIVAGRLTEWWNTSTAVPVIIGLETSNTKICAVNLVTIGTGRLVGHKTVPIPRWMGSIPERYSVTFWPATAYGAESSSTSIAEISRVDQEPLTPDIRNLVSRYSSHSVPDLQNTTAQSSGHGHTGSDGCLAFEHVRDRYSER